MDKNMKEIMDRPDDNLLKYFIESILKGNEILKLIEER